MPRTVKRFFSFLPALFSLVMGAGFIFILILLVIGQPVLRQYYQPASLLSNAVLFPAALAAVCLLFFMAQKTGVQKNISSGKQWIATILLHCIILGAQFLIARSCWYKMGWDVATVYTTAEELALGLTPTQLDYFKAYPNNAPLTLLHAIPMWVAVQLGMAVPFVVLPYIDAVLLHLAATLCCRCVYRLTANRISRAVGSILSWGWIALSPYILYPYTDTFSILFPVLALYLFLLPMKPIVKWFLISLVSFIGAAVKPTVLIILIALIMLAIIQALAVKITRKHLRQAVLIAAVILLGLIPGKLFNDISTTWLVGTSSPAEEHGLGYWFLTGMNGESWGGHWDADVAFADSFSDYQQRQSACFSRAWERLTDRTLAENLYFFTVKTYKAYADGSFASHSSFLELETPKRSDSLSLFLRSLYHKRGALMPYCQTLIQGVWLAVLTLCACSAIRLRRHPAVAVLSLTLLGLTLYLLLFEVWPRYLFLYAPVFIILSSMAFEKPLSFKR